MKTWDIEAKDTLKLHEERQREHGKGKSGRPDTFAGKRGWGIRDTAKEMGKSIRRVLEDLRIAEYLRDNPDNQINRRVEILEKIHPRPLPGNIAKADKKAMLQELLATLKSCIVTLDSSKSTKKIAETLRKALKDYEG
jgi:hypothetical protein